MALPHYTGQFRSRCGDTGMSGSCWRKGQQVLVSRRIRVFDPSWLFCNRPGHLSCQSMQGVKAPMEVPAKDGVFKAHYLTSYEQYSQMYEHSTRDPSGFWGEIAEGFHWAKKFKPNHFEWNFDVGKGPIVVDCFNGGVTNICYNALDRHVENGYANVPCLLWEGNDKGQDRMLTYKDVLQSVSRLANWLKAVGVKKGDAVAIYMPMVPELTIAMLACARIGAVHSVVFGGFSAEALAERTKDCAAKVLLTASGVMRGKKQINLKSIADKAMQICARTDFEVPNVLVYSNDNAMAAEDCAMTDGRDEWWHEVVPQQSDTCDVEWVEAEHPLFLLYTSGSTGKPKGVLHTTAGYMVYTATTTKYVFNLKPKDVYWCTADCGWITGHSYLAYGPLLNGATNVVFEGIPTHPTPARCWEIIDKFKVKQFYTAPTAIRSLMGAGNEWLQTTSRDSLEVLGTVGEPINPEAWKWYFEAVGHKKCPVVDTWWQTETGGHMITPLPRAWAEKPGSATLPFFGVVPAIINEKGEECQGEAEGVLCIKQAWPSAARTIFGDHERYETTYFKPYPGYYFTGDGCKRDRDGYYWITGRVDDVINVSGHRIGTAEVESALVGHANCAEAAVVPFEHSVKGQGIYAFVSLIEGAISNDDVKKELANHVREAIGAFAAPDVIHWAPNLPKTRSGKIMRRVLRKIASKEEDQLGDVSTLADPSVIDTLVKNRGK